MKRWLQTILTAFLVTLVLPYLVATPQPVTAQESPLVLAFYYAWFDQNTWTAGRTVDLPAVPYTSSERETIERHVAQAQGAGIDALVQSWYGPQVENNQTETNFRTLLDVAQAKGFKAAVDFEITSPFLGDVASTTSALTTLLATHAQHPAYLRYQGKPVIFFWRQQQYGVDTWAAIRNQVDPNRNSYWIAEGVDIAYQSVFDGHHLYSIAWAASPAGQLAKWGDSVRSYEAENQVDRLWIATAMPGYNDTRLPRSNAFAIPRSSGDYYRETWQAALASQPDMVMITSFNEWPEGTHIEPSAGYGNLYLDLTRELVTNMRGAPPPAPLPAAAVQLASEAVAQEPPAQEEPATPPAQEEPPSESNQAQEEPPPAEPYIQVEAITNVRTGPATNFEVVGRLPADSAIAVIGRTEAADWWVISYSLAADGLGWVSAEVVTFVGDAATVPLVDAPPEPETTPTTGAAVTPGTTSTPATASEAAPVASGPEVEIPAGGTNVRSGPGLNFDLLGRATAGEIFSVTGKDETNQWWQITYPEAEDGTAWIATSVVTFIGNANNVPLVDSITPAAEAGAESLSPTPALTPTAVLFLGTVEALDAINVRSEPSIDGVVLGGMFLGDTADVLAVSIDGEWWQIDFADAPGEPAWVAAEFVTFSGNIEQVPVFGQPTATPTLAATPTPQASATPTPPPIPTGQPTLAPTATSVYQATSEAMLSGRDTPPPDDDAEDSGFGLTWSDIPWGIISIVVILAFMWYQFVVRRRKGRSRRLHW